MKFVAAGEARQNLEGSDVILLLVLRTRVEDQVDLEVLVARFPIQDELLGDRDLIHDVGEREATGSLAEAVDVRRSRA